MAQNREKMRTKLNVLKFILVLYSRPHCFMDNILQNARTEARKLIFGVPEENVGYTTYIKDKLEKLGHFVTLSFTNQKETIQNVEKIIIADEVLCQKEVHLDKLAPHERRAFVTKWMNDNSKIFGETFGLEVQ